MLTDTGRTRGMTFGDLNDEVQQVVGWVAEKYEETGLWPNQAWVWREIARRGLHHEIVVREGNQVFDHLGSPPSEKDFVRLRPWVLYDTGRCRQSFVRAYEVYRDIQGRLQTEESVTVTEPNKAMWMGVSFRDEMADQKLKYAIKGQGLFFGYGMGFTIQHDTKAKGAKTDLILDPDSQFGKIGTMQWTGSAKVAGLQVLEPIFFNTSTTDFGPVASKVKASNSDFLEMPFVTGDQITNVVAALKDAGYKGRVYPGNIDPVVLDNIVKKVGKEYVEGWECVYYDPKGVVKDPEIVALIDAYQKEYKEWRSEGCFWMSPWFLFKDAVETTKSVDVDTVVKYLQNSKKGVKTFEGYSQLFARPDLKNYKTVDSAPGCMVAIIKDGKLSPLKVVAVKDQYLVSIKAMGLADTYEKYWQEYGKPTFPPQPSLYDFSDLKL